MKKIIKSFYGKISILFLVLLIILGGVQLYITIESWTTYFNEADQKLNIDLAANMAKEIDQYLEHDSLDLPAIEHAIHYMMVFNPKIEIYILDDSGEILAFFADPPEKVKAGQVNLDPIHIFLEGSKSLPIQGEDPRRPGVKKPFSAARIKKGDKITNYLYIILGGELYDSAISAVRNNYIIKTIVREFLVTLIFTSIIGLILFSLLTRRLKKMSATVSDFEHGQFEQRLNVRSDDEIGQLAMSFNNMADTITANLEALKATDRIRRELIANVSHDLRSPMSSIRGYLETIQMKNGDLSSEDRQNYIEVLLETTSGLEKLIEELFELSKLDARQIQPNLEPFSIRDLVQDVMMKIRPMANYKGIKLEAAIPDALPQVYADIGLIERVLNNLLENAINYTPDNGLVKVEITKGNQSLHIKITDTGAGISETHLPHIFERFYRVEKSRAQNTGGTGLGLAIAQKIMEMHNSRISVESKLQIGSSFAFDLAHWPQVIAG